MCLSVCLRWCVYFSEGCVAVCVGVCVCVHVGAAVCLNVLG